MSSPVRPRVALPPSYEPWWYCDDSWRVYCAAHAPAAARRELRSVIRAQPCWQDGRPLFCAGCERRRFPRPD